jgi:hypothetical protein
MHSLMLPSQTAENPQTSQSIKGMKKEVEWCCPDDYARAAA